MVASFTGARQAEVLGLKWGDIDWDRRTAEIRRQWRRGAFDEAKTKSSSRTVELPDELVSALKRWRLCCTKGEHDLSLRIFTMRTCGAVGPCFRTSPQPSQVINGRPTRCR
jgi:integrase